MGDRIAQLILEQIKTPDAQEVEKLNATVRGEQGFGSTAMKDSVQNQNKDPSRVSVLQRVQGKPRIKTITNAQNKSQFISVKQMQKLMKKKEQVFLCIKRRNDDEEEVPRRRRSRGGKKNSIALGAAKAQVSPGMTEKAKREMSKIVGPKKNS